MNVLAVLVLGLLIGWLAEWVIDWFYWRNRIRPVAEENANLKEKIKSLEARKNKRSQQSKTKPIRDRAGKDNLQAIKGIGPVIAKRLNDAGVYTFEELAQLTPDAIHITRTHSGHNVHLIQPQLVTDAIRLAADLSRLEN